MNQPTSFTSRTWRLLGIIALSAALLMSAAPTTLAKPDGPVDKPYQRIRPVNSAPVIEFGAEYITVTMSEDGAPTPFSLSLSAFDADGDPLQWFISTPPVVGVARVLSHNEKADLAYKSPADYTGQDSFGVTVMDKSGRTDSIVINVTVLPVSDPPDSHDVTRTLPEDTAITFSAADFPFSDPDAGDTLHSVQIAKLPEVGRLYLDVNGNTLFDTGEAVTVEQIVPIGQLNALTFSPVPDEHGAPYAFLLFRVNDGAAWADYDSLLMFNVTSVNDAPVNTMPDNQTVNPDTDLPGLIFSINDNDDSDTNNFAFTLTALHGTLTLPALDGLTGSGNGTSALTYSGSLVAINVALSGVTYRGLPGYTGPDMLLLASSDQATPEEGGPLTTSTGTIVMVATLNRAPHINGGPTIAVTMSEDGDPTPFDLTLSASDEDADLVTWTVATPPANGQAVVRGSGNSQIISYRSFGDYAGADSFVVQVTDGRGGTDAVTINVTIEPINDAPQSSDVQVSTPINTDLHLGAAFPYADVDGDPLHSVRFTVLPDHGTLYLDRNTNGTFDAGEAVAADQSILATDVGYLTFQPTPDESGVTYTVLYFLVNDGQVDADYESQLTINVLPGDAQARSDKSIRSLPSPSLTR